VIQRVTQQYNGVDNKRSFLIDAGSAKQAWKDAAHQGRLAAPSVIAAAIVIVALVKNAQSQNDTRTTGFVTVAEG
jgi:hypothetical protein